MKRLFVTLLLLCGCGGVVLPKEPAILIEAGTECIYAAKKAAYEMCAQKAINSSVTADEAKKKAAVCMVDVDKAFKPKYDAIDTYRCLLDESTCKQEKK